MIRAEFRKLTAHWQMLVLIVILIAANTGLIFWQAISPGEHGYSPADVGQVYEAIEGDQAAFVQARIDTLSDRDYIRSLMPEEYERVVTQIQLCRSIAAEIDQAAEYGEYLAGIESEAKRMEGASLLFQADSFSSRNIVDLAQAYQHLERRSLTWVPSEGMLLVTDNVLTDLCILLCLTMLILLLTASERAAGYHPLIRTAPAGCSQSWLAKLLTLGICTIALLIGFYLPGVLTAGTLVGFGELSLPVQSMAAYYGCPYSLTTGQFLVWFFVLKALAILGIAAIVYCFGCFFSGNLTCFAGVVSFLAFSWLAWLTVDRLSWFGILKECSAAALLNTHHYFERAYNVNAAGYPVSTIVTGGAYLGVSLGIVIPLSAYFWNRPTQLDRKFFRFRRKAASTIRVSGLGMLELRKLLITNRAAIITAAAMLLLMLGTSGPKGFDQTQYYYRQYAEMLAGEVTEETGQRLKAEEERFAAAELEIEQLSNKLASGEISSETFFVLKEQWEIPYPQEAAYHMACEQYQYLSERKEQGFHVAFLDETGWQHLAGDWGSSRSILNTVWIALVLSLCLYNFGTMENTSRMELLIACAPNGWQRVKRQKRICACCYAALVSPLPYVHQLFLANHKFALDGWNALSLSIASVQCLGVDSSCPVFGYLVLKIFSIAAESIIVSLLILEISHRFQQSVVSLFGCLTALGIILILSGASGGSPILAGRIKVEAILAEILLAGLLLSLLLAVRKRKN